jgi:hypothetical protein
MKSFAEIIVAKRYSRYKVRVDQIDGTRGTHGREENACSILVDKPEGNKAP